MRNAHDLKNDLIWMLTGCVTGRLVVVMVKNDGGIFS